MKKSIIALSIVFLLALLGIGIAIILSNNNETTYDLVSSTDTDTNYKTEEDNINWNSLSSLTLDNEDTLNITTGGVYTLTGNITSGIVIDTTDAVKLILKNAKISNNNGAAIYVKNAKIVYIYLEDGTTNYISDGTNYTIYSSEEDVDGAIYSKDDLVFDGNGTLYVDGNYKDAIVSKDSIKFINGTYNITAKDDGIRGKDYVVILNGTYTINASGDGIKSSNDSDSSLGYILIENGNININASSDGIQAVNILKINGGTINITAEEGLEATYVKINGGTINISASDDGINASKKTEHYTPTIEINGGNITIKMGQGDTDAIDSNGNLYINGGTLNITANSPFDYDGEAKYTSGTMIVNGDVTTTITNQFMGGPNGGQGGANNMQPGNGNMRQGNMQPSQRR